MAPRSNESNSLRVLGSSELCFWGTRALLRFASRVLRAVALTLVFFIASMADAQMESAAPTPIPAPTPVPWTAKFTWSGDLRYRGARSREDIDDPRVFQQLRARLKAAADVNEQTGVVLRLATGTGAISTNQTLGDSKEPGSARRNFGLDLAYADWHPEAFHLWLGRIANPFWAPGKAQIVYDSDLAFEGIAAKYEYKLANVITFGNAMTSIISENYAAPYDDVDTGIAGAQLGATVSAVGGSLTVHVSYQSYLNIQNRVITSLEKDAKTDPYSYPYDRYRGNTVRPNDPLLPPDQRKYFFNNNYVLRELGLEISRPVGPVDVMVFYDQVFNEQGTTARNASEGGISLKWDRYQIGWASIAKDDDSVVGAFTDSDANGGGTDNRGTRLAISAQLSKNAQIAFADFRARRGLSAVERDFSATQLDAILSF